MKFFLVLSAMVALAVAEDISFYITGDDQLDADKVMKDPVVVKKYMDCYLDRAPCDSLAQSYKDIIVGSLATSCSRCNDKQKHLWNKFLWYLKELYPEEYAAFQQKYDPDNVLLDALKKVVSGY